VKDWKRKAQEKTQQQMQAQQPAEEREKPTWSARRKAQVPNTGRNRKEQKG
jgi:hypothetical protein